MQHYKFFYLVMTFFIIACGGSKEAIVVAPPIEYEEETLDTLEVVATSILDQNDEAEEDISIEEVYPQELPIYNPSETRYLDILHTDLDLRFDWQNQHLLGQATIIMAPLFYPQDVVTLDAKGFDINVVRVAGRNASYNYDGKKLTVDLPKSYQRNEKVEIFIDYVAKPNEGEVGGSAAITSDKGLFFIDPLDTDPNKPSQIWTQGETEHNSRWFPTFDKPNERTTQEVSITIEDKYVTLSNGVMVTSINNNDGTRTDTWKMDKPHAPYLFMLAIGEYAVVKEQWNDLELSYYVEEEYRPYAKEIFNHTPEMLTFFANLLDYPYPWDKYAQVICRDYVSGAMENTTASIFGEFIQKNARELVDNDNDYIVAHELFHQWFGNLVTCESWANLTLQEGFANYSEYLWFEYKYGRDRADDHRQSEFMGYLQMADAQGTHPLIYYTYEDKEQMFDAHSYNKGGLVLHMLRDLVGDEAFFASLNKYLRDNEYSAVEVDELRMAFEDITGMDLQWFFDQWYLSAGHPILEVDYHYDTSDRSLYIDVDQVQDQDNHLPIYRMEFTTAVYDMAGKPTYYPLTLDQRSQGFVIEDIDQPSFVVLDGNDSQLAVIKENKEEQEYYAQLKHSDLYLDQAKAAQYLANSPVLKTLESELLQNDYYAFRILGLEQINLNTEPEKVGIVSDLLEKDSHSEVRNIALDMLSDYNYEMALPYLEKAIEGDDSYKLAATALSKIKNNSPEIAVKKALHFKDINSGALVSTVASILAGSGNPEHLSYFENKLSSVSIYSMFNFYNKYYDLIKDQSAERKFSAVQLLADISKNGDNMYRKFMATSTISKLKNSINLEDQAIKDNILNILEEIKATETNENLKLRYNSF